MNSNNPSSTSFKPRFIAFEGLDGTGKSSLIMAFEVWLKKRGIDYLKTREPGGTPLGDDIRDLILRRESGKTPCPKTELLLYQASRSQHVDEIIRPGLIVGKWVLTDRFSASSIAFQAGGRQISQSDVEWLNHFSTSGLLPDLNLLLDLSTEEARTRRSQRGLNQEDRMESEADEFHERVRQSFLGLARKESQTWLVLDARLSTDKMLAQLIAHLESLRWLD